MISPLNWSGWWKVSEGTMAADDMVMVAMGRRRAGALQVQGGITIQHLASRRPAAEPLQRRLFAVAGRGCPRVDGKVGIQT